MLPKAAGKLVSFMEVYAAVAGNSRHILIPPAREADDDALILSHPGHDFSGLRDGMGALYGTDDSLGAGQIFKGGDCLLVSHRHILRAAGIVEPGVLRAYAGIVEAGGNIPWKTPRLPLAIVAAWRPVSMPSPAASQPIRRTSLSPIKL